MSTFERYDEAAAYYDGTRVPVGVEIIRDALARLPGPAAETCLLDAGCGTGAYTAALNGAVGRIIARIGPVLGVPPRLETGATRFDARVSASY